MKKRILSLALALTIALSCAPFSGAAVSSSDAQMYYQAIQNKPGASSYLVDFDNNGSDELVLVWDQPNEVGFEVWANGKKVANSATGNFHIDLSICTKNENTNQKYLLLNSGFPDNVTFTSYTLKNGKWTTVDRVYIDIPSSQVTVNGTPITEQERVALEASYLTQKFLGIFDNVPFNSVMDQLLNSIDTPLPLTDVLSTLSATERKELFDIKLFSFTGSDEIDFRTASEKELLEAIHAVHYTPDCTYQFKYDRDIASYNGKYLNYKGISKINLDKATLELFGRTINLSPYQQKVEPDRWDWDSWSIAYQNALYLRDDYWVRTFSGSIDVIPEHLYDLGNDFYCAVHREYWDGEYWDWDLNQMVDNDDDDSAMVYYSIVKKNSDGTWRLVHLFPNTYVPTVAELTALVGPSSWAKTEVEAADKAGLIPDLTGDPGWQDASTRLQFCQLAVQLAETALGETLPAAPANTFTDCSDLAVRKAYAAKIVNGMTETTFSPNGTLTREQLATMLWRAVNYIQTQSGEQTLTVGGSLTGYTDAGSVSSYAKDAVAALNKHGIMKGTSNTALSPKGSCTVEQSVLLSYRTFLKLN